MDNLDVNSLRDFLFYELMADDNLKDKFLYLYEEKILFDKDYYYGKLDYILDCGKVGDYNYTGVYDLNVIGGLLYEFINSDIGSLIRLEEDTFASELLNKCAFLLQEHLTTDSEFWYDCAFMYSILANKILMRNEDNPNKVFEDLYDNDYNIRRLGL